MTTRGSLIVAMSIIAASLILKFVPAPQPPGVAQTTSGPFGQPARYQLIKSEYGWVLMLDTTTGEIWSQKFNDTGTITVSKDFWDAKAPSKGGK